jgi:hypothetical protein
MTKGRDLGKVAAALVGHSTSTDPGHARATLQAISPSRLTFDIVFRLTRVQHQIPHCSRSRFSG